MRTLKAISRGNFPRSSTAQAPPALRGSRQFPVRVPLSLACSGGFGCFCCVVWAIRLDKLIDLLLRGVLREAVAFLYFAYQLLPLAIDRSHVVVRQFSPFHFYFTH